MVKKPKWDRTTGTLLQKGNRNKMHFKRKNTKNKRKKRERLWNED